VIDATETPVFEQRLAGSPPHPKLRRAQLFPGLSAERVAALLDDPQADLWIRRRLRGYKLAVIVRSVGWCCGVLTGLVIAVAFWALTILASTSNERAFSTVAEIATIVLLYTCSGWFYLYWGVGFLAPSTRFAAYVRIVENQSTPGRLGRLSRTEIIYTLDSVGKLGRRFFRVVTRRTLNIGVRPDLSEDVAELCQRIMLAIPGGGVDDLRRRRELLADYRPFIRDVLALLVVQRVDLVKPLADAQQQGMLMDSNVSDEMRLYLQPLARRTTIEAVKDFVMPAFAIGISIVALIVSAFRA